MLLSRIKTNEIDNGLWQRTNTKQLWLIALVNYGSGNTNNYI